MNYDDVLVGFDTIVDLDPEMYATFNRLGEVERAQVRSERPTIKGRYLLLATEAASLYGLEGPGDLVTRWVRFIMEDAPELVRNEDLIATEQFEDGTARTGPLLRRTIQQLAWASATVMRRSRPPVTNGLLAHVHRVLLNFGSLLHGFLVISTSELERIRVEHERRRELGEPRLAVYEAILDQRAWQRNKHDEILLWLIRLREDTARELRRLDVEPPLIRLLWHLDDPVDPETGAGLEALLHYVGELERTVAEAASRDMGGMKAPETPLPRLTVRDGAVVELIRRLPSRTPLSAQAILGLEQREDAAAQADVAGDVSPHESQRVEPVKSPAKPPTKWRDVQRQLLEIYDHGGTYTTIDDLADRMKCSGATIVKAIKKSRTLRGWQTRHLDERSRSPRATSLGEIVLENVEQTREPASDATEFDEIDVVYARLIDEATPDERAKLNAMTTEQHRELATMIRNDPDRGDRVLGRRP